MQRLPLPRPSASMVHMEELLLVDKPKGITSFDVIRILRRKLGIKKMGHAGTLDPRATGLLLVGIGQGTKKLKDLIGLSKVYEAEIRLGIKTDSGDMDGKVLEEKLVPVLLEKDIVSALDSMSGEIVLAVPAYSAIKRDGIPLYKYAREGREIEIPQKTMTIIDAEFLGFDAPFLKVKFNVKSGTYIRSLAEELGKRLGTVATLENLRRLSIGKYRIEDAIKLE
jgi:tRNA pseudouridine55 synthase